MTSPELATWCWPSSACARQPACRWRQGPARPILGEEERAALLAALECVDHVTVFDDDPHDLLHQLRPHVLAKGGTYSLPGVVGRELVESYGGRVYLTGTVPGRSTSRL